MKVVLPSIKYRITLGNSCLFFLLLCSITPLVCDTEGYFKFRVPKYLFFGLLLTLQSLVIFLNRKKCESIRFNTLSWAYCVFFVTVGIAQFSAYDQSMSLHSSFERMEGFWFYASLFLFSCLCSVFSLSNHAWKLIFLSWVGVSVLVCISGFAFGVAYAGEQRMASTLGNTAYLAHYLLSSLLLLFLFATPPYTRGSSFLLLAIVLLLLTGIFFTFSRTTYLGIILGALVYGITRFSEARSPNKSRLYPTGIWLVPVLVLIAFLLIKYYTFLLFLVRNTHSLLDRVRLWQIAFGGIKERPWLGWGTDNYIYVYEKYSKRFSYPQTFWYDRSHNVFLEWFINGGVLTGISFIVVWLLVLWHIWKSILPQREKAILTVWWVVSINYLLLNIDNLPNWILLLLISQYLLNNQPTNRIKVLSHRPSIVAFCFLLMAGGASIFCLSIRKTGHAYYLAREYAKSYEPGDKLRLLQQLDGLGSAVNYDLIKPALNYTYTVLNGPESKEYKREYGRVVLRFIEKEIEQHPPSLYLHHKKAGLESMRSDSRAAIETYRGALALNSRFLPAYLRIGYEYLEQKQYPAAYKYFDEAAKIAQDSTEASIMKLKIMALTLPEYTIEETLDAFPSRSLVTYGYMVKDLFASTRSLAHYLTWIENGGYDDHTDPTHQRFYEWIMCAYELGDLESMEQALHSYQNTYPCLPALTNKIMELVRAGGNPSQKLTEFRKFCG